MRIGPGERFGNLLIKHEIARGAFAVVYLARDILVERTVALKVMRSLPSEGGGIESRLALREARMAGRLSSPHIVTLYHLHDLGDAGWVVELEYVDGPTLHQVLEERGKLSLEETARILRGVLSALHVAHDNGVVHRDVKPSNVLLGTDGAVKLADFGLSGHIGGEDMSVSSLEGLMGTPHYVAPEVIGGDGSSVASDIWSAGVLFYRMLTGSLPFDASTLPDLFETIQNDPVPPPAEALAPPLNSLILGCLRKEPSGRPRSAAHLLAALEDLAPAP